MNQSTSNPQPNYSIAAAVALIVIGGIFLLRNFDVIDIGRNWWAWFMLIPIAYIFSSAWRRRQENDGKFPPAARNSLVSGAVLVLVMCIFLFDLNWGMIWPVFLILGGLSVLVGARS